jgi:hypothetical protein
MGEANTVVAHGEPSPDLKDAIRDYLEPADWTRAIPSGQLRAVRPFV